MIPYPCLRAVQHSAVAKFDQCKGTMRDHGDTLKCDRCHRECAPEPQTPSPAQGLKRLIATMIGHAWDGVTDRAARPSTGHAS